MALQNRVDPYGVIHAVPERGSLMGNRGGKFHLDDQTLGKRRWASHHWICCELHFKNRHHEPMGKGYTSLFFLDEVTALAAGHRPCFECRRAEAKAFLGGRKVNDFDRELHGQRLATKSPHPAVATFSHPKSDGRRQIHQPSPVPLGMGEGGRRPDEGAWPQGTMFETGGVCYALKNIRLLRWSFAGYAGSIPFVPMNVLTPPAILAILEKGYQPRWHSSALQWDGT